MQSTKKNGKTLGKSKGKINRREKATRRIKRQHQTSRVSSKEAKHEIKTEKVPHTKCLVVGWRAAIDDVNDYCEVFLCVE